MLSAIALLETVPPPCTTRQCEPMQGRDSQELADACGDDLLCNGVSRNNGSEFAIWQQQPASPTGRLHLSL